MRHYRRMTSPPPQPTLHADRYDTTVTGPKARLAHFAAGDETAVTEPHTVDGRGEHLEPESFEDRSTDMCPT